MEVDLEGSSADPEGNLSVWIAGRVRVPEDYIALSLQISYFIFHILFHKSYSREFFYSIRLLAIQRRVAIAQQQEKDLFLHIFREY